MPTVTIDPANGRIYYASDTSDDAPGVIGYAYPGKFAILQYNASCPADVDKSGRRFSPIYATRDILKAQGYEVSTSGTYPPTAGVVGLPTRKAWFIDWFRHVEHVRHLDVDFNEWLEIKRRLNLYPAIRPLRKPTEQEKARLAKALTNCPGHLGWKDTCKRISRELHTSQRKLFRGLSDEEMEQLWFIWEMKHTEARRAARAA